MAATITTIAPTADDVRAFAAKRGIKVAEHGRLSRAATDAFNKAHKRKYEPTFVQPAKLLRVPGKKLDAMGRLRKTTYEVTAADLRTWAQSNGFSNLGNKGRIPDAVFTAYGLRESQPAPVAKARKSKVA